MVSSPMSGSGSGPGSDVREVVLRSASGGSRAVMPVSVRAVARCDTCRRSVMRLGHWTYSLSGPWSRHAVSSTPAYETPAMTTQEHRPSAATRPPVRAGWADGRRCPGRRGRRRGAVPAPVPAGVERAGGEPAGVRRATMPRKPATKSGTSGGRRAAAGRRPCAARSGPAARTDRTTAATSGASSATRISFTSTAWPSASGPAVWAVATTWPDVVHAGADPAAELPVVQAQRLVQQRQYGDGERAAQRDEGDGGGDVPLLAVRAPR